MTTAVDNDKLEPWNLPKDVQTELKKFMSKALVRECDMTSELQSEALDLIISAVDKANKNYEVSFPFKLTLQLIHKRPMRGEVVSNGVKSFAVEYERSPVVRFSHFSFHLFMFFFHPFLDRLPQHQGSHG